jgi:DNA replication protein DnaC
VSSRDSHGGEGRIKAARFSGRKTLEEFDFTFQRSVKQTVIEHLGQLDFLPAKYQSRTVATVALAASRSVQEYS